MVALLGAMFVAMGSVSAAPSVSVSFPSDRDAVVDPGSEVTVTVTVTGLASDEDPVLNWIRVSGELDHVAITSANENFADTDTDEDNSNHKAEYTRPTASTDTTMQVVVPLGTTPGEYTVSAQITIGTNDDAKPYVGTKVLTVGDAGDAVTSAEISLSTVGDATSDSGEAADNEVAGEDYFDEGESPPHTKGNNSDSSLAPEGTPIYLKLTVLNSLGKVTDDSAVTAVDIIAPGGLLSKHDMNADDSAYTPANETAYPVPATKNSLDYAEDNAVAVTYFAVTKEKAGSLDVEAVVVGSGGIAKAETFTVTFTGGAASISLSAASSPLGSSGMAYVDVTAVDASDNAASLAPDQITAAVPSDSGSNKFSISKTNWLPKAGKGFDSAADSDRMANANADPAVTAHDDDVCNGMAADADDCAQSHTTVRLVVTTTKAGAGEHELEVKLGSADTATTNLIVAGSAASIAVESDSSMINVTDILEVSVMVTDEGGNPVVNKAGSVEFDTAGDLKLSQLGSDKPRDLKDGKASARFVVVSGSGTAIIIATYDEKLSSTVSFSTPASEPEAMPEEEASVACLSNLNGFSTWSCGVESSASEIFDLVSGRGATALHLWNGTAWVRYSVVDGTMVPGSSDFMVAENDILYISN